MAKKKKQRATNSVHENFWGAVLDSTSFAIGSERIESQTRIMKPRKYKECRSVKYSNAESLCKYLKFDGGERYNVIVPGNFIFGDFIEAFFVKNNIHTDQLTISTLSMSQDNVDSLANLMKGGFVERLRLIVSDYFYANERRNLILYAYKLLDMDNRFQLAVAGSHTKIVSFKTRGGKHIVISGSANLRSAQCLEQFFIEDNVDIFNFFEDLQNKIIDKYMTINHSVRGGDVAKLL